MWIRIEPLDVLLFREAKPFSAGENITAIGQFPPTPLPIIGALRNWMLSEKGIDFEEYKEKAREFRKNKAIDYEPFKQVGGPDDLGPIKMTGPFLVNSDNILCLPSPKDLLINRFGTLDMLRVAKGNWAIETSPPDLKFSLEPPGSGMRSLEDEFLNGNYLGEYLLGNPPYEVFSGKDLIYRELRLGIELASTRTAKSGQIYTVGFTRMEEKATFLLSLEDEHKDNKFHFPKTDGFLSLGGESRAAHFGAVAEEDLPLPLEPKAFQKLQENLIEQLEESQRFKLYLMTPAIFRNGWLPDGVVEKRDDQGKKTYCWEPVQGITATLVAAAVGKPQVVGGWDLVNQSPRPMFRAVPAGSVYYFETNDVFHNEKAINFLEKIHFKSLMAPPPDAVPFLGLCRSSGFGLTAVGLWKNKEE